MGIADSIGRGFGLSGKSIGEGFEFDKKNWAQVYKYLLVSSVVAVVFLGLGAAAFIALAALGAGIDSMVVAIVGGLLFVVLLFVGMVYGGASSFAGIRFSLTGKREGYFEGENVSLAFRWSLFLLGVFAALGLAILGAVYLAYSLDLNVGSISAFLLILLGILLAAIAWICLVVFTFYSVYEVAIGRKGPIGAVLSSVRLAKENFFETVVFLVLMAIIGFSLGLIIEIIYYFIYFLGLLLSAINPLLMVVLVALALLVMALLRLLVEAVLLPMQARFYNSILRKEGKGKVVEKEKIPDAPAKKAPARKKKAA